MGYVIYKYKVVEGARPFNLEIPVGSKMLGVQMQRGEPMLWVLQPKPPVARTIARRLVAIGTGMEIESTYGLNYIGTFQNVGLVWHLFECTASREFGGSNWE